MGGIADLGTDRIRAEQRLSFLAEASELLSSTLDYESTLQTVAEVAVPRLGDWCVVYLLENGSLRQLAVAHSDPELARWAAEVVARSKPEDAHRGVARVVETREPELIPHVTPEDLRALARNEEHLEVLRRIGLCSFMSVPLLTRDAPVGALTFLSTTSGRVYGDEDVQLATELARRAAAAVENARLYRESESARNRLAVQSEIGAILTEASGADVVPRILEIVCRRMSYEVGALWQLDSDGRRLHCTHLWHDSDCAVSEFVRASLAVTLEPGSGLPGRIWASREPAWIEELSEDADFVRRPAAQSDGLRSGFGLPVVVGGETIGALEFFSRRRRRADAAMAEALLPVGSQIGQYLERRRAETERTRVLELEREARAEAEAAAETLRKLERVTQAALAHIAVGDLLDEMLRQIVQLVDAETGAILLVGEDGRLRMSAALGFRAEREHAVPIPIGEGLTGHVAASGEPTIVNDLAEVQLFSPVLRERGIASLVAVPISADDRVIGIAHVGSTQPGHFTESDVRLLTLTVDRIALAIDQARLYDAERRARSEAERAQHRVSFLAEASTLLAASLDYRETLQAVAQLAVPHLADWCVVDLADETGMLTRLATAHVDPEQAEVSRELERRWPAQPGDPAGPYSVMRTGASELAPELPDAILVATAKDDEHLRVLRGLGTSSYMCVPLRGRDRLLGTITFITSQSGRRYDEKDLALAEELARRAAVAVENAFLFLAAEERGQAARVLAAVGDGVFLLDRDGVIRYWNPAAAAITGLAVERVIGHRAADALPGWSALEPRVPVAGGPGAAGARWETLPLELGEHEVWISISGVGFDDGIVYAFRDITQDRMLDELKSDFVSTVSHELRTPLAAIYGAAMTLRRQDVVLPGEQRDRLLAVVARESERLAGIVNDILWASRLDSNTVRVSMQSCDAVELASTVIDAANAHRPERIRLRLTSPAAVPPVVGDPDKIRQILVNLVDNAINYSPDGGTVELEVQGRDSQVVFAVHDEGLGIPPAEQRRIFEKFYRLDPNLTRGVGGTGLGLYICRELVRRMNGRLWVVSPREGGTGSTFAFELPAQQ
jgi:signal transduction histidine kinase